MRPWRRSSGTRQVTDFDGVLEYNRFKRPIVNTAFGVCRERVVTG